MIPSGVLSRLVVSPVPVADQVCIQPSTILSSKAAAASVPGKEATALRHRLVPDGILLVRERVRDFPDPAVVEGIIPSAAVVVVDMAEEASCKLCYDILVATR